MKLSLWLVAFAAAVAVGVWLIAGDGAERDGTAHTVRVARGTVVREAVAVGRIEAEHEIPIKSSSGGIVTRIFVRPGQRVKTGDPLIEVRPEPTSRTFIEAERAIRLARDGETQAQEFVEGKHLASWLTRFVMGGQNLERMKRAAQMGRERAEEHLKLLKEGVVEVEGRVLDFVVRSPVDAHVLIIRARKGEPIVPSSSYGSGTVTMLLADMNRPVFRGTVDEIDVGRLREGMPASLSIGALPGRTISGQLEEIALKGVPRDNATLFDVRIAIEPPEGITLRAGYSAVARIVIDRRDGVLVLPERVVEFRGGEAVVRVEDGERRIQTGLSDGLIVEVLEGLEEGQAVVERVYEN